MFLACGSTTCEWPIDSCLAPVSWPHASRVLAHNAYVTSCNVLAPLLSRGGNQGLIKIITHGIDKAADAAPIAIAHESKLSARLDGGKQPGMVVASKAMEMAISKVMWTCKSDGKVFHNARNFENI